MLGDRPVRRPRRREALEDGVLQGELRPPHLDLGGQRWLWKLPDEEVTERWERDRRGWVADKAWEGVDVESVTLTFSMLATEDEVTLTSDPAALGLQLCLVDRVR